MRFTAFIITVFYLLLSVSSIAWATNGYNATVPIASLDRQAIEEGFKQALTQVLTNLSGDAQKVQSPEVQSQIGIASRFAASHNTYNRPTDNTVMLSVIFDSTAVNELMKSAGLTLLWQGEKPALLSWVMINRSEINAPANWGMAATEDFNQEATILADQAKQKGITLYLPALDLEERVQFGMLDFNTSDRTKIKALLDRYGLRHILMGQVQKKKVEVTIQPPTPAPEATTAPVATEGSSSIKMAGSTPTPAAPAVPPPAPIVEIQEKWVGSWRLITPQGDNKWETKGKDSLEQALREGINQSLSKLTTESAVKATTNSTQKITGVAEPLEINILNVRGLQDYARVMNYLSSLNVVQSAQVQGTQSGTLRVKVMAIGGLTALDNALSNEGRLQAEIGMNKTYRFVP